MEAISTISGNGVKLEEYQGNYSLISTREDKSGKHWPQWAKFKKGKDDYQEKDWTVAVKLGDKKTALAVLTMLLEELEGKGEPF